MKFGGQLILHQTIKTMKVKTLEDTVGKGPNINNQHFLHLLPIHK